MYLLEDETRKRIGCCSRRPLDVHRPVLHNLQMDTWIKMYALIGICMCTRKHGNVFRKGGEERAEQFVFAVRAAGYLELEGNHDSLRLPSVLGFCARGAVPSLRVAASLLGEGATYTGCICSSLQMPHFSGSKAFVLCLSTRFFLSLFLLSFLPFFPSLGFDSGFVLALSRPSFHSLSPQILSSLEAVISRRAKISVKAQLAGLSIARHLVMSSGAQWLRVAEERKGEKSFFSLLKSLALPTLQDESNPSVLLSSLQLTEAILLCPSHVPRHEVLSVFFAVLPPSFDDFRRTPHVSSSRCAPMVMRTPPAANHFFSFRSSLSNALYAKSTAYILEWVVSALLSLRSTLVGLGRGRARGGGGGEGGEEREQGAGGGYCSSSSGSSLGRGRGRREASGMLVGVGGEGERRKMQQAREGGRGEEGGGKTEDMFSSASLNANLKEKIEERERCTFLLAFLRHLVPLDEGERAEKAQDSSLLFSSFQNNTTTLRALGGVGDSEMHADRTLHGYQSLQHHDEVAREGKERSFNKRCRGDHEDVSRVFDHRSQDACHEERDANFFSGASVFASQQHDGSFSCSPPPPLGVSPKHPCTANLKDETQKTRRSPTPGAGDHCGGSRGISSLPSSWLAVWKRQKKDFLVAVFPLLVRLTENSQYYKIRSQALLNIGYALGCVK